MIAQVNQLKNMQLKQDNLTPKETQKNMADAMIQQVLSQFKGERATEFFIGQDKPTNILEDAKFIVIEGMDYSGKSTLAKQLAEKLEKEGKKTKVFSNPGGEFDDFAGINLRGLIKQKVWSKYPDVSCTLFLANRLYLHHKIKEAIGEGYTCIVDRWDLSAHVYQAPVGELKDNYYYRDIPLQEIKLGLPQPDLMIVLHPSYEVVKHRYHNRPDRGEYEGYKAKSSEELKNWYDKISTSYLEISTGLTASFRWRQVMDHLNVLKKEAHDDHNILTNSFSYQNLPIFNQKDRFASGNTLQYLIYQESDNYLEEIWQLLCECYNNTINTNPTEEEIHALRSSIYQQHGITYTIEEEQNNETKTDDTSAITGE